jgi:Copper amine oxidase N-terminal domain/NHL repeat
MKKIISVAVILVLLAMILPLVPAKNLVADSQYESSDVIGYGPIGGELLSPGCIGVDENGKIYIIDRASGGGFVYLSSGIFFKSFKLPSSVSPADTKTHISVRMGNICYTSNDHVTVASTSGDPINRIGKGITSKIKNPIATFLLNDLSILVADITEGLVLYNSKGEFERRPVTIGPGGDVPNIVAVDVSTDGKIAILSIERTTPKEGDNDFKEVPNKLTITLFSPDFIKLREISIATTIENNPSRGVVRFDSKGNIYFYSISARVSGKYSSSGNLIASLDTVLDAKANVVISGERHFFVDSKRFFSTTSSGEFEKEYATFDAQPMQFDNPVEIATCSGDGIAVFDDGRGDIQFFDANGPTGTVKLSKQMKLVLSTNSDKQTIVYYPIRHEISIYDCTGIETEVLKIDAEVPEIVAMAPGKDGNIWTLSRVMGRVTRINKGGIYVNHFGSLGKGEDQLVKPVDVLYGFGGNIYVLDAGDGKIKVFNREGEFVNSFGETAKMKNPTSICLTEDLVLVVSDTGNNKIHFFSLDGKLLYSKGEKSPAFKKTTIDDYWSHLGTFNNPTKLATSGKKIYILDNGNQRVQVFEKGVVKPVLKLSKEQILFGQAREGILEDTFSISNSSTGTLKGTIETDVNWIRLSKESFNGNVEIKVTCDVSSLPAWVESTGTITINSNGGSKTISVKASRNGNLIVLQINSNNAVVNGESVSVDPAPSIQNGSTVVPLRFIGEALGATIEWEPSEKRVTYKLANREVILWVGVTEAMVNGKIVSMSVAPMIINGRTVVPLRFIGEALGATVEWIGETRSIKIYYPVNPNIG